MDSTGTSKWKGVALHEGEAAADGAVREAWEEAGVPAANVELLFTSVFEVGYWSYTTVAVAAVVPFEPNISDPVISDPKSLALEWVPLHGVAERPLHPGFGKAWPGLRRRSS